MFEEKLKENEEKIINNYKPGVFHQILKGKPFLANKREEILTYDLYKKMQEGTGF